MIVNAKKGRKCQICGKGSQKSATRSHSKVKTIHRQKPNLQKTEGVMMCQRCHRTNVKNAR